MFRLQVTSTAADVLELFIYLEEPCHVSQILVTVSHGGDDCSFPGTMDVRTGCNLDALKPVLEVTPTMNFLPRIASEFAFFFSLDK